MQEALLNTHCHEALLKMEGCLDHVLLEEKQGRLSLHYFTQEGTFKDIQQDIKRD